jgi:hypothetical protein
MSTAAPCMRPADGGRRTKVVKELGGGVEILEKWGRPKDSLTQLWTVAKILVSQRSAIYIANGTKRDSLARFHMFF